MSSCTNPLFAVRLYKPLLGKSVIKILSRSRSFTLDELKSKYGYSNILELPCGHCLSCISNKRKEWAVRCCLEAQDWKENCFVTLTYDPEFYDDNFHRDHVQVFFKNLRNRGFKLRYYGCAERGDEGSRCHYHSIIFGFFPPDAKFYSKTKSGFSQFTSKLLSECWPFGFVTVSDFHPAQASYVAGYVLKKLNGCGDFFHFQSTRPGIGQGYVLKNVDKIYDTDRLVLSFGSHLFGVPRYFDKVAQECFNLDLDDVKARRLECANRFAFARMRDSGIIQRHELLRSSNAATENRFKLKRRLF